VALATSFTVASAAPTSIASLRARVAHLEATLADQQRVSEALAQHYDAINARLAGVDARIRVVRLRIQRTQSRIRTTGRLLRHDAVSAYIFGSDAASATALFTQGAAASEARGVYESTVIGNVDAVAAAYAQQVTTLTAQQRNLHSQAKAVTHAKLEAARLKAKAQHIAALTNAEVQSMSARIRHMVLEAAIAAARRAAAAANAAGASGAAGVAGQLGGAPGSIAATLGFSGSISGSGRGSRSGMAAFAAAETQLGVPYVWGGEAPGVGFDCSGLTQWAWSKAGVSIPRTAASQWYSLRHVSLTALQPGDLLFYFNLDGDNQVDHVVMYGGSGPFGAQTTIAASHAGTPISLQPAFTYGLIGAARP
jgi:cell wall-associated NlpC family hydrolase